jgi:hypothetical protein
VCQGVAHRGVHLDQSAAHHGLQDASRVLPFVPAGPVVASGEEQRPAEGGLRLGMQCRHVGMDTRQVLRCGAGPPSRSGASGGSQAPPARSAGQVSRAVQRPGIRTHRRLRGSPAVGGPLRIQRRSGSPSTASSLSTLNPSSTSFESSVSSTTKASIGSEFRSCGYFSSRNRRR